MLIDVEQVLLENDQVRELAYLDTSELVVHPYLVGTGHRNSARPFRRRLGETPLAETRHVLFPRPAPIHCLHMEILPL